MSNPRPAWVVLGDKIRDMVRGRRKACIAQYTVPAESAVLQGAIAEVSADEVLEQDFKNLVALGRSAQLSPRARMVATLLVAGFDVTDIAHEFRISVNTIYRLRQQFIEAAAGSGGKLDESEPRSSDSPSSERRPRWVAVSAALGTVALLVGALTSIVSIRRQHLVERPRISAETSTSGSPSAKAGAAAPIGEPQEGSEAISAPSEGPMSRPLDAPSNQGHEPLKDRFEAPAPSTTAR